MSNSDSKSNTLKREVLYAAISHAVLYPDNEVYGNGSSEATWKQRCQIILKVGADQFRELLGGSITDEVECFELRSIMDTVAYELESSETNLQALPMPTSERTFWKEVVNEYGEVVKELFTFSRMEMMIMENVVHFGPFLNSGKEGNSGLMEELAVKLLSLPNAEFDQLFNWGLDTERDDFLDAKKRVLDYAREVEKASKKKMEQKETMERASGVFDDLAREAGDNDGQVIPTDWFPKLYKRLSHKYVKEEHVGTIEKISSGDGNNVITKQDFIDWYEKWLYPVNDESDDEGSE